MFVESGDVKLYGLQPVTVKGGASLQCDSEIELGGLTIEAGGVRNRGMTIQDVGLKVKGGLILDEQFTNALDLFDWNMGGGMEIGAGLYTRDHVGIHGDLLVKGGLTLYGTLQATNAATAFSDRRLKKNISPILDARSKVSSLQGVYFNWIHDAPEGLQFDSLNHVGVIAQQVEEVLPEIIDRTRHRRYLAVDYVGLIPLLVEALRDLTSDVMDRMKEKRRRKGEGEREMGREREREVGMRTERGRERGRGRGVKEEEKEKEKEKEEEEKEEEKEKAGLASSSSSSRGSHRSVVGGASVLLQQQLSSLQSSVAELMDEHHQLESEVKLLRSLLVSV